MLLWPKFLVTAVQQKFYVSEVVSENKLERLSGDILKNIFSIGLFRNFKISWY